ncbi:murein biosynthesis integral membrane protein MurJ [Intrasporangium sp. YIM S08009]|uniref:murein biosynthesis integral membrane protein MurJ n=1 Tax=Intrasporangium zincisolvens TaxID=3080018 RepID=UPI002B054F68|nr:lipid II flippase MurJ [Intrasporangium sp. YIM S08009]
MSAPATGGPAGRRLPGAGMFAAAGTIAVITLVARVVGFGRWFVFSHSVGATCVGSVYQSVNAVPNVLFEIAAGGVLAAVAVPLVAGALARGARHDADTTASALLTWVVLVLVPLGLLVALAARPIASALLGTGCAAEVDLGAELLVVFAAQVPLYGLAIVLAGVLQAHRRFVGPALAPLLSSLVVIATYLLYRALVADPAAEIPAVPGGAIAVLAGGTTLGVLALGVPLLVPVRRAGIRLRPRLRFPSGVGARVRTLAVAGLLAVAGQQVATLVVIRLANDRGGAGTLNVYTYAQAVMLLPYAVLAVPLATAAFPSLAGAAGAARPAAGAEAVATLRRAWLATLVVGVAGVAGLVAVARPVGWFFANLDAGAQDDSTIDTLVSMGDAVTLFAPSVLGLAVIGLLTRASYVRGSAVLAGALAAGGWLASAVIALLVLDPAGAGGPTTLRVLAASTSAGLLLGAVALAVLVAASWGGRALAVPFRPLLATTVGAVVAGLAGRGVSGLLEIHGFGRSLGGSLVLGLAVGALAIVLMAGLALAVDPSLLRRLRRDRVGSGAGTADPAPASAGSTVVDGQDAP